MCTWEGMQKISHEKALELFLDNKEVFLLYDDDSESLVEEENRIREHYSYGGEFGVEK